jgi:hypothetical protein
MAQHGTLSSIPNHIYAQDLYIVNMVFDSCRGGPSDIDSDVSVYFPSDMFTTNPEFAVNQRHMINHCFTIGNVY